MALAYLDLDELDGLLGGRLVAEPSGARALPPARLSRRPRRTGLADAVRAQVELRTGWRPTGPIRLLTQLRTFGHCFNPVSFYYCFTPEQQLEAVVAEVTSTPWGERHAYVLARTDDGSRPGWRASPSSCTSRRSWRWSRRYLWRVASPGATLSVHIESRERERPVFDATLALRRAPLTRGSLVGVTARYPAATLRVLALIYGHALALKLKGVPVHPRPQVSA